MAWVTFLDACVNGNISILENILSDRRNISCLKPMALKQAVRANQYNVVNFLLNHNIDPNSTDALNISVSYSYIDIIKLLLKYGADINQHSDMVLVRATIYGNYDVIKLLIDANADVNAQNGKPLRNASNSGYIEIVKLLVDNNADVHARNDQALIWACLNDKYEIMNYLISVGNYTLRDDTQLQHLNPKIIQHIDEIRICKQNRIKCCRNMTLKSTG